MERVTLLEEKIVVSGVAGVGDVVGVGAATEAVKMVQIPSTSYSGAQTLDPMKQEPVELLLQGNEIHGKLKEM